MACRQVSRCRAIIWFLASPCPNPPPSPCLAPVRSHCCATLGGGKPFRDLVRNKFRGFDRRCHRLAQWSFTLCATSRFALQRFSLVLVPSGAAAAGNEDKGGL